MFSGANNKQDGADLSEIRAGHKRNKEQHEQPGRGELPDVVPHCTHGYLARSSVLRLFDGGACSKKKIKGQPNAGEINIQSREQRVDRHTEREQENEDLSVRQKLPPNTFHDLFLAPFYLERYSKMPLYHTTKSNPLVQLLRQSVSLLGNCRRRQRLFRHRQQGARTRSSPRSR